jgi:hypothetical protein
MFKVSITTFLFFLFLLLPQNASAHLGGGPPFMKIDGKYSQTNPNNQGSSTMTMSWDTPPAAYLVNKPITFDLDVPVLLQATTVPPEYAKDIKIRWSIATGDNFEKKEDKYEYGTSYTRTFTKPGSYLVITEAKLPADSDYILLNTVQVDILPNSSYSLPVISITIGTHNDDPKQHVLLVSDSLVDPSTKIKKYLWDFSDDHLHEGTSIDQQFDRVDKMGVQTIFHRVVDENGFIADIGFQAEKINDKLHFESLTSGTKLPITIVPYDEASRRAGQTGPSKLSPVFIALVVGALLLLGCAWWVVFKRK